MEYFIAVYRSRDVSVRVAQRLRETGYVASLCSTPRAAGVGCGLSVRLKSVSESLASSLAAVETFAGIFAVRLVGGKSVVVRM